MLANRGGSPPDFPYGRARLGRGAAAAAGLIARTSPEEEERKEAHTVTAGMLRHARIQKV